MAKQNYKQNQRDGQQAVSPGNSVVEVQALPPKIETTDQARSIAQVQAMFVMAKKFPRDETRCYAKIMERCRRPSLAMQACYSYPRGEKEDGTVNIVTGPSIRLAEEIASCWQYLDFGYTVIDENSAGGFSVVEAYCLDYENGSRSARQFRVQHKRKAKGRYYDLTDPRDLYELTANMAARNLRAVILQQIPYYVKEDAANFCKKVLADPNGASPQERITKAVVLFRDFGVTQEMIAKRLGHPLENTTADEVAELLIIYNSLYDRIAKVGDYFEVPKNPEPKPETKQSDINAQMDAELQAKAGAKPDGK